MTSLRGHERREFPLSVRKLAFKRCCRDGVPYCEASGCGEMIRAGHLRFEHLQPDGLGGEPTLENCGAWCDVCSTAKDRIDNPRMVKADRVLRKTYGMKPKGRPMPGSKASGLKKLMNGQVVRRS